MKIRKAPPRQKGRRGQAAVTDALYFLLIITSLAVFLFAFANGYGNSVSQSLQRKYEVDFASSAMETLFNQSIPRDTTMSIDDTTEADYLLTALKEDYADDLLLNETGGSLTKSISDIMSPISDSRDYLFFLHRNTFQPSCSEYGTACREFIYVLLKTSKIPCSMEEECSQLNLCSPPNDNPGAVQNLLIGFSNISQSEARVLFVQGKVDGTRTDMPVIVKASLTMWPATKLDPDALTAMNCAQAPST